MQKNSRKLESKLDEVTDLLRSCPLRDSPERLASILGERATDCSAVLDGVVRQCEKLGEPLNVVLMGEVKAGKSTLLNAFLGRTVAAADVLEATAALSVVHYSDDPTGTIYRDVPEVLSFDEVVAALEVHKGDSEYFRDISHVGFGLPTEELRGIRLIDTPGLETTTKAFSAKTEDFFGECDIVLFVLSPHHIGQQDILMKVAEVARQGKQIHLVVSRCDELESHELARLEQFVKQTYGPYTSTSWFVSAREGLRARLEADEAGWDSSGLAGLSDFIRTSILENKRERQREVIQESVRAYLLKEIALTIEVKELTTLLIDEFDSVQSTVRQRSVEIQRTIEDYFVDRIDREVLGINGSEQGQPNSEEQFNKKIDSILKDGEKSLEEHWSKLIEELKFDASKAELQLRERVTCQVRSSMVRAGLEDNESMLGGLFDGGSIGLAGGMALAGYAAWLGPAAAFVSIGAAASVFVLPAVILGGAIGATRWMLNRRNKGGQAMLLRGVEIEEARRSIRTEYLEKQAFPMLRNRLEMAGNELLRETATRLFGNMAESEMRDMTDQLDSYLEAVESLARDMAAQKALPAP